jgi:hypothetical protein
LSLKISSVKSSTAGCLFHPPFFAVPGASCLAEREFMIPTYETIQAITSLVYRLQDEGLVSPLGLVFSVQRDSMRVHAYKYVALPEHPRPGDAGRGYSHPVNLFSLSMRPDYYNVTLSQSLSEITQENQSEVEKFGKHIVKALGWTQDGVAYDMSWGGSDGRLDSLDITRGNIPSPWAEYPSDMAIAASGDEHARIRGIRKEERKAVEAFREHKGWGGKRDGAGKTQRLPDNLRVKTRSIDLSDAAYDAAVRHAETDGYPSLSAMLEEQYLPVEMLKLKIQLMIQE